MPDIILLKFNTVEVLNLLQEDTFQYYPPIKRPTNLLILYYNTFLRTADLPHVRYSHITSYFHKQTAPTRNLHCTALHCTALLCRHMLNVPCDYVTQSATLWIHTVNSHEGVV